MQYRAKSFVTADMMQQWLNSQTTEGFDLVGIAGTGTTIFIVVANPKK